MGHNGRHQGGKASYHQAPRGRRQAPHPLRISEELLQKLDKLAVETNRSHNERMILILEYGVENIRVE